MTFADLKTELFSRGANYLEESSIEITRAERWINQAYREILNLHAWPFLHTTAAGIVAGTLVPDLRKVLAVYVSATNTPLIRTTRQNLIRDGVDLAAPATAATPEYWFLSPPSDVMIGTYPISSALLVMEYVKRAAPLTGTEEPIFDEEYHNLIVDKAMIKVYIDSDNFDAANALKAETDAALVSMAEDYLLSSTEHSYIEVMNTRDG